LTNTSATADPSLAAQIAALLASTPDAIHGIKLLTAQIAGPLTAATIAAIKQGEYELYDVEDIEALMHSLAATIESSATAARAAITGETPPPDYSA
jgi:hypothetical protein